jgi:hypothetical protein
MNQKRSWRWFACAAAIGIGGCLDSSTREHERTGSSSAATTGGGVVQPPILFNPCGTWDGSQTDLLAADAVAACSAVGTATTSYRNLDAYQDRYLAHVYGLMAPLARNFQGQTLAEQWINFRANPTQCDPNDPTKAKVTLKPIPLPITLASLPDQRSIDADADLRTATVNLCVAQQLRNRSPGTAGNEAIFFADAEQRQLLEVIRERVQIAMLQYALLGEAFVLPPLNGTIPAGSQLRFPTLNAWAASAGGLEAWGNDLASALQLHSMVTQELGSLYARSRSARSPRGSFSANVASLGEEYWGAGSWHQRTMALMFGGDPLAMPFDGASLPQPGAPIDSTPGTLNGLDWPTAEKAPYFTAAVLEPQVQQLLLQARHFNAVELTLSSQPQPPQGRCQPFDLAKSASLLYTTVERAMRAEDCAFPQQGQCTNPTAPPATTQFESYLLWQKHRITPTHAATLVQYLAEALAPSQCNYDANDAFQGAYDLAGYVPSGTILTTDASGGGTRLAVQPSSSFVARTLSETEPTYTRLAPFRAPSPFEFTQGSDVGGFGFNGGCRLTPISTGFTWSCSPGTGAAAEQKRTMGAMAAEAAVREMLISTVSFAKSQNSPRVNDYLKNSASLLKAISANVGDATISIVPILETFGVTADPAASTTPWVGDAVRANGPMRVVMTFDDASSTAAATKPCVQNPASCTVFAIQGPYAANIGAHPEVLVTVVNGGTTKSYSLAALVAGAGSRSAKARLAPGTGPGTGLPTQLVFDPIQVPNGDGVYSFILQVGAPSGGAAGAKTYLLAGNTLVRAGDFTNGQYVATDGALGTWVQHQTQMDGNNPAEPAYDGFDLPNHWVPPFTAELLGGDPRQSSVSAYMALAQSSADDASKAVQTAIEGLAQQEKDAAELQAAVAKAKLALKQDRDVLCGANNPDCDTSFVRRSLDASWYQSAASFQDGNGADAVQTLRHATFAVVQGFLATSVDLANPVAAHVQDPSAPSFAEFSGGQLQEAFIEQWRAVRAPDDRLRALAATQSAAEAQIAAADAVLGNQQDEASYACSSRAKSRAMASGISFSVGLLGGGVSYSDGPLIAQQDKCRSLANQLGADRAKAAESIAAAIATLSSAMVGFADTEASIAQSSAKIHALTALAAMADARARLDAKLAASTQISALPLFHRYRDYDMWRAKALLEGARRYALAARRAIEARYVVDLTRLNGNESFVASPSSWADEVYNYDLSMPASVGLVVQAPTANGIYTNKIKDYVGNLQAFVAGYAASRPSAVAHNDLDVITLPGLQPGTTVQVSTVPPQTIHPDVGKWSLHCAGAAPQTWTHVDPFSGDVMTACGAGGRVDLARLEFTLDPWGRREGGIANEPYQKRFNARWDQMALNFVGTGIKDCTKSADPPGCYSSGFIPYNLTHVGPAWVTDYDEMWRLMNVPRGRVEAGKALASEIWLDPLKDGWSTSYISAVARTELELRPLGGAYELEFVVSPELLLNRIERVQLLVGSSSWVKQQ